MKRLIMVAMVAVMGLMGFGCASSNVCKLSMSKDTAVEYDKNVQAITVAWAGLKVDLANQISQNAGGAAVVIVERGVAFTVDSYFGFLTIDISVNGVGVGTAYVVFRNDSGKWTMVAIEVKAPIAEN